MNTVGKFLQNLWYTCPVLIIRQDEMDLPTPFYELQSIAKKSLFTGNANELRSECYRNVLQREVINYGILENTLVIEVR